MKVGKGSIITLKKGRTEIKLDPAELRKVVLALRVLDHEARQHILTLLETSEWLNVTDIFVKMRTEQSIVSQHLSFLRKTQLVETRRQGKFIFYTVNAPQRQKLEALVHRLAPPVPDAEHPEPFEALLGKAGHLMRALSHPLRLRILEFLDKNKSVNVNKIYSSLKLEQSITSLHLSILREAGLVESRRESKFVLYSLDYAKIQELAAAVAVYAKN